MGPEKRRSAGFTLLEVMIVVVMMVMVSALFYEVTMYTADAVDYALAFNQMAAACQKASNRIKEDLSTAKEVFGFRFDPGSDPPVASGTYAPNVRVADYRAELVLPIDSQPIGVSSQPRIGTGILPTLDPNGMFGPDDITVQRTGNCLMFIKTEPAFSTPVQCGPAGQGLPNDGVRSSVMIDVYRIIYYYLTEVPDERVGGVDDALDLVRWESIRFVDKDQLEALAVRDPWPLPPANPPPTQAEIDATLPNMQSEFIRHLIEDTNIHFCWDTTEDSGTAFYRLAFDAISSEYVIDSSPVSNFYNHLDPAVPGLDFQDPDPGSGLNIPRSKFDKYERVIPNLAAKRATVSWNTEGHLFGPAAPNGAFKSPIMVPRFGYPSNAAVGFPHGLEVQVVGPSGARQVLVRLVLTKETTRHRTAAHETVTIVSTRDF